MAKGYLPLFFDTFEETQDLTDEEFGRLIRAIGSYANGTDDWENIITGNEKYAFRFLRGQIDRNAEISKVRAKAGSSKKEQAEANDSKQKQTESNDNKNQQSEAKSTKEKEKEKENKKEESKRFTPPTVEEVAEYCRERNNQVDPEKFHAFYASKGWKVGNQPMKDWKMCVITWEKREDKPVKAVPAAQYEQRSYLKTDAEARQRMIEMMRGEAG